MRELRHNDPSLFKGCVHLHNLQDVPRLHTGRHTSNENNKKSQRKKKEPVFFILHIYLSKLSVQLFAILLVTLVTVVFRFSYRINSIFIIVLYIFQI